MISAPTSSPEALRETVAAAAARLGFDVFGATSVDAPLENGAKLQAWLNAGCHGTMAWMANNLALRLSPRDFLPNAQTVLFFGVDSRRTPPAPKPAQPAAVIPAPPFRVARYAQGRDYHKHIHKRLKSICALLADFGGEQRACVDTAPVMEKLLAARAGLGWQGRSTLLVHPKHGPWLLLGGVFTTLAIAPDAPSANHCGACRRCVDACPTGAIDGAGSLDARRCAAYFTIEHKGAIPEAYRARLGDRLFGCDTCLESCPWGRKTVANSAPNPALNFPETASLPPYVNPFENLPPLYETLRWTEAEFAARFNGTPVRRLSLYGWLRNACVVLGNTGTPAALPALRQLAETAPESPFSIAEHAHWAIAQIQLRFQSRDAPA